MIKKNKKANIYFAGKFFRQTIDGTLLHLANVPEVKTLYHFLTYCLSVFPPGYFVLKKR
jgi:hypothetical protein